MIEESPILDEDLANDDYYQEEYQEVPYDPSPTKLKEVSRPENILKNEVYQMLLREPVMNGFSNI